MKQIVITRTALGEFKVTTMGLAITGMGQTLDNYRGGFFATLWCLVRLVPRLTKE